jgi:hypothetical protein
MANFTFAHERYPSMVVGYPEEEQRMDLVVSELFKIGYKMVDEDWLVGGSQEISLYRFQRGRDKLVLQAETYEDIKLFGAKKLLDEVQQLALPVKPIAEQPKHP